jgi:hypothetical protein
MTVFFLVLIPSMLRTVQQLPLWRNTTSLKRVGILQGTEHEASV